VWVNTTVLATCQTGSCTASSRALIFGSRSITSKGICAPARNSRSRRHESSLLCGALLLAHCGSPRWGVRSGASSPADEVEPHCEQLIRRIRGDVERQAILKRGKRVLAFPGKSRNDPEQAAAIGEVDPRNEVLRGSQAMPSFKMELGHASRFASAILDDIRAEATRGFGKLRGSSRRTAPCTPVSKGRATAQPSRPRRVCWSRSTSHAAGARGRAIASPPRWAATVSIVELGPGRRPRASGLAAPRLQRVSLRPPSPVCERSGRPRVRSRATRHWIRGDAMRVSGAVRASA